MEKKDLLQFCRYYNGEKDNPFNSKEQNKSMLWDYERAWVDANFTDSGKSMLSEYIGDYASVGLTLFEIHDSIPASLKALLFNRYAKGAYTMIDAVESFKNFYQKYYK